MRIEEADAEFGSSHRTLLIELLDELEQSIYEKLIDNATNVVVLSAIGTACAV
jgi:hypothetical protein